MENSTGKIVGLRWASLMEEKCSRQSETVEGTRLQRFLVFWGLVHNFILNYFLKIYFLERYGGAKRG